MNLGPYGACVRACVRASVYGVCYLALGPGSPVVRAPRCGRGNVGSIPAWGKNAFELGSLQTPKHVHVTETREKKSKMRIEKGPQTLARGRESYAYRLVSQSVWQAVVAADHLVKD